MCDGICQRDRLPDCIYRQPGWWAGEAAFRRDDPGSRGITGTHHTTCRRLAGCRVAPDRERAGMSNGLDSRRGIFFDRDGVLNSLVYYADTAEWESPRNAQDFQLMPGALDVLSTLQQTGWLLFLVSNQPSYAKGKTSLEDLHTVHAELDRYLNESHQVSLAGVYYCYHHPQGVVPEYTRVCECRKPGIGSLLKAQAAYDLDLSACW